MTAISEGRDLIDFALQNVVQRKRLVESIARALDSCAGKVLRDRYLADILTQSLDGAVVQVCSAGRWVGDLLKQVRARRLNDFSLRQRPDPAAEARVLDDAEVASAFMFLFPDAVRRAAHRPNAADIASLERQLATLLESVKRHRDKIVAHWDPGQHAPATWGDLATPFLALEALLSKPWVVHTRATYLIETLSPHPRESTSQLLADGILR